MKKDSALKWILGVSILGMLFSGYLSYGEIFQRVCILGGSCTGIAGVPVCFYGLVMYIIVFVFALIGLRSR